MRIIIPVKPLAYAKSRLASVLSEDERAEVMRGLLNRVLAAARYVAPVSVITADRTVAAQAIAAGADVIDEAEVEGLDAAARRGVDHAWAAHELTLMILAADLPDVTAEAVRAMVALARPDALVIAPSRDGGTNALIMAPRRDFRFAYGLDSFARHSGEARRLGLEVVVHESLALSVDIDWPEDLASHRDLWAA